MKKSWYQDMFENEDRQWWFVARRGILSKILDAYLRSEGKDRPQILEVGCGTGGNLKLLSGYGNLHAVEYSEEARALAEGRGICPIQSGFLPDGLHLDRKFDWICLLDVLEYIDDDLKALQTLKSLLKPGGRLLLTIPAYKYLFSYHDIEVENKRRYDQKEMLELVRKADLKLLYSTYFNTILFPPAAGARLAGKWFKIRGNSDVSTPSPRLNALLTKVFSAEGYFIPRISLPYGLSILMVAENPIARQSIPMNG